jgi:hypothetical protein
VGAGDTVDCPPTRSTGTGATADTFMSHLFLVEDLADGGDLTAWLEAVDEQTYQMAQQS